ncbi:hypothetical protein TRFO_05590 [Tritrichomonas foetus]|uniref:Translin-associated factor X-interacting protein 1 N-terminal domain-containing protein n=1 Tax=Tritrichomonas foetus TaxID=1144522 RepID=A0A1J4K4S2_9EUKA|nr:hypothetical protein TRFO_05590 [Tritrichomonas foetus]|eukprot:OHT06391.1 hypothetical protein TRFO_05590 [Tritrichomonas foetus]
MEIQPPSSPREGRSRRKNPRNQKNFRYQPLTQRPSERVNFNNNISSTRAATFYHQIREFLDNELSYAHSDSDRIFAYKRAFDTLLQEFQACRPILAKIKQNYDQLSTSLIQKKRSARVNSSSKTINDDTFAEMVNNMRRSRDRDFQKREIETEKLLEEMTQLRIEKSDLTKEIQAIVDRQNEIKVVEETQSDIIFEENTKIHNYLDEIKTKDAKSNELQRKIAKLEEKYSQTQSSSQELTDRDNDLLMKLTAVKKIENELETDINNILNEQETLDSKITELEKEIWVLQKENNAICQKHEGIKQRKSHSDRIMRELLSKYYENPNLPIIKIIQKIAEDYYY